MAVQRIKVNLGDLAALEAVAKYFEDNVSEQSQGRHVATTTWRPLENLRATLQSSLKSLDPAKALKQEWEGLKTGLGKNSETYNQEVTGKINETLQEFYAKGDAVSREETVSVGPFRIRSKNTINALVRAKTAGEAAAILLKDCIPCDLRLEAVNLVPDISFLDQLINVASAVINTIGGLIETILGLGANDSEMDLCITLNMFNFTCLPDFSALAMLIAKGINLSVSLPSFSLSPVSNLAGAILLPFLAIAANLVKAWSNLIFKPVDCLLISLETLIKKFRFQGSKIAAKATFGVKVKGAGLNETYKTKLPGGAQKALGALDNTKKVDSIVAAIEKLRKFILGIKKKIQGFMNKLVAKYQKAMNQFKRFLAALISSVQEVLRLANLLMFITVLGDLFTGQVKTCQDKEKALEEAKKAAGDELAKRMPGVRVDGTGGGSPTRVVQLTRAEAEALNLLAHPGVTVIPLGPLNGPGQALQLSLSGRLSLDNCPTPVAYREQFLSVDSLIEGMS